MALQWETDCGLQTRTALALVIVVVLPVAFVYAFVFVFLMNTVGVELLTFATEHEWRGRFYVEPWLIVIAVAAGFAAQYFLGEASALRAVGARRVGLGPEGTVWRVPLDKPEPFTPEFGPFVAERTLVVGGSGEVRGYWRSQLR